MSRGRWVNGASVAVAVIGMIGTPLARAVPVEGRSDRDFDPLTEIAPDREMHVPGGDVAASEEAEVGDLEILVTLHHLARMQIGQGKLAEQKSRAPKIKAYARKLVREHQTADQKISALIRQRTEVGLLPAPGDDEPVAAAELVHESLLLTAGRAFDEEFLRVMVEQHGRTKELLSIASQVTGDPELRDLVGRLLSAAQRQRSDAARLLQRTLNAKGS